MEHSTIVLPRLTNGKILRKIKPMDYIGSHLDELRLEAWLVPSEVNVRALRERRRHIEHGGMQELQMGVLPHGWCMALEGIGS